MTFRAYINFKNDEDVFNFRNRFDGYVFVDARGNDYHAVVEFATYQKVPLSKSKAKKDPKVGTIFEDTGIMKSFTVAQNLKFLSFLFMYVEATFMTRKLET